jgi:hypothetical protein
MQYLRMLEDVDVFDFSFQHLTTLLMLMYTMKCFIVYGLFTLADQSKPVCCKLHAK